jgi:single-strand DNA-binding protein
MTITDLKTYRPDPETMIKAVCKYYKIKREDLFNRRRHREVVNRKFVLAYLLYEQCGIGVVYISRILNVDHTSVIHYLQKFRGFLDVGDPIIHDYNNIITLTPPGKRYPAHMNNCTFIGNLGKDAEVKEVGGSKVINFSIAVKEGYGDKATTLWVDCAKWGEKTGIADYLKKGTKVAVSGSVSIRKWDTGATITLRVLEIELLGSRDVQEPTQPSQPSQSAPAASQPMVQDDLPF